MQVRLRASRISLTIACAGAAALPVALLAARGAARDALGQAWPPFALVAGLLLIGMVAADDGLFEMAGAWVARLPGGTLTLFASSMALVALVTVLLTLDTSVVFLTPILVHTARRREVDEAPFVYGCVFMSNSASLLLPGSNLTNLIVLSQEHVAGGRFAAGMLPAWIAAVVVTGVVLALFFRVPVRDRRVTALEPVPSGIGLGAVAASVAVVVVLLLPSPALVVLVLGAVTAAARAGKGGGRDLVGMLNAPLLGGLFGIMVGLGAFARVWGGPAALMESANRVASAALGAGTSVVINNLPAAALLSSGLPAHARSLLIGLDAGPNLAVTGSLSAIFWLRVARASGSRVSAVRYSRIGIVIAPLAIAAALAANAIFRRLASDPGQPSSLHGPVA